MAVPNKIEGLEKWVPVTSAALAGRRATRPDVPDLCVKCVRVIAALEKAALERPDTTELNANCTPLEGSIKANINIVVHGSGEGGSDTLKMNDEFCLVAHNASRGTGM